MGSGHARGTIFECTAAPARPHNRCASTARALARATYSADSATPRPRTHSAATTIENVPAKPHHGTPNCNSRFARCRSHLGEPMQIWRRCKRCRGASTVRVASSGTSGDVCSHVTAFVQCCAFTSAFVNAVFAPACARRRRVSSSATPETSRTHLAQLQTL